MAGRLKRCISSILVVAIILGFAVFYKTPANAAIVKEINLYSVASDSPVHVPDGYATQYQITLDDLGLTSGTITRYSKVTAYGGRELVQTYATYAVNVSSSGLVTPGCWYYNSSGVGTVTPPSSGYKSTAPYAGDCLIRVTVSGNNYDVLFHHYDYSRIYGEQVIDQFIADNITPDMSIKEIVTAATKWTAETYSYGYKSSAIGMAVYGYGDCWASADMISTICQKCGLHAWDRNANRDSGAGSGHRNAIIEDPENGVWYIGEAGYGGDAPRRYSVDTRTSLFCYRSASGGCEVYQLDADDEAYQNTTVIEVPSEIDGRKVVSIGNLFLEYNKYVSRVVLPEDVLNIGKYAFSGCSSLSDINIPSSVTTIGVNAFENCTALRKISIPDGVTNIGNAAFYNCRSLGTISIPSGITSIGSSTFYSCISLGSIYIPTSVTSIGANAFANCSGLTDVYFEGTEEEWNTIEIGDGNGVLNNVNVHFNSTVNVYGDLPSDVAVLVSKSLNLDGKIGVNFKLSLPQDILSDSDAYIDINGTHYGIDHPDREGYYTFTYYCAAAQTRDNLVITVHRGDGSVYPFYTSVWQNVTDGFSYSVDAYSQRVSSDATLPDTLRELVDTMSDYGKQAQVYFDYNADAGKFTSRASIAKTIKYYNLTQFEARITSDSTAAITRKSSQLELDAATTIIHNFTLSSGSIDDYVITVDGKVITTSSTGDITLKEEDGIYRLRIANIAAAELQIPHKVVIKDQSGKTVINISNYSALSYAYAVLVAADPIANHSLVQVTVDQNLVNLLKMLYKYNRAAMAYWGITDVSPVYDSEPEDVVVPDSVDEPEEQTEEPEVIVLPEDIEIVDTPIVDETPVISLEETINPSEEPIIEQDEQASDAA